MANSEEIFPGPPMTICVTVPAEQFNLEIPYHIASVLDDSVRSHLINDVVSSEIAFHMSWLWEEQS